MHDDQRNPFIAFLEASNASILRPLMICLPGHVVAFNNDTKRAQIQCGLQRISDGEYIDIPVIINVPVHFPGSPDWILYHELPAGTEGLIHFSQRAVDTWIMQGGVTTPFNSRMFDASDAFFSPGFRSNKTVIKSAPNSGMGMTNADGSMSIHLDNDSITLTAGGSSMTLNNEGLTINGKTIINGGTDIKGDISLSGGSATHEGTNIGANHVHSGVETGRYNTGGPQ